MNSIKKTARVAGFLYIIGGFSMAFAQLYVRSSLIVWGDATATANNIMTSESLFRIGFVIELIGMTCFVLVPLFLYKLLKPVNKNHALLMVIIFIISVPIMAINMLNHFAALQLLSGDGYLKVFEADQLHALVMFFLELHSYGYLIAQIFFGLWLLPLGFLVFKSGFIPRILGILLMIASFGYMIQFITIFLFPSYSSIISPVTGTLAGIGELSFMFWLLIRGVNLSKMKSVSAQEITS